MLNLNRKNKILFHLPVVASFQHPAPKLQAEACSLRAIPLAPSIDNSHSCKLAAVPGSYSLWFGMNDAKRSTLAHTSVQWVYVRRPAQKGGDA